MAPIFRATLEKGSNFQKIFSLSHPDRQQLQTIRENSVLSIFESGAGIQVNFSTYHADPNIYSLAPIFRATLEKGSNFQKIFSLSHPDRQQLQTIRENSVLSIFESGAGIQVNFSTYHADPNIYSLAPIFRATLEYRSNFQKIFGLSPPD